MERFSIVKFLSGFNIFSGEKLAKIVYYLIIVSVCITVFWAVFLKPQFNTIQHAQTIQNITTPEHKDFMFFGIKVWKIKLGASVE